MIWKLIREIEAEPGSSVSIVTRLWAGGRENRGSIPCESEDFSFPQCVETGIRQTSYPNDATSSSSGEGGRSVKLASHLQLVPNVNPVGSYASFPHTRP
jgi:hypothetical protein